MITGQIKNNRINKVHVSTAVGITLVYMFFLGRGLDTVQRETVQSWAVFGQDGETHRIPL